MKPTLTARIQRLEFRNRERLLSDEEAHMRAKLESLSLEELQTLLAYAHAKGIGPDDHMSPATYSEALGWPLSKSIEFWSYDAPDVSDHLQKLSANGESKHL